MTAELDNTQPQDLIIVPVGDKVVVKPIPEDRTFANGSLIIPETAEEKPQMGLVIASGTGHLKESGVYNLEVREGEMVLFSKYAGAQVKWQGEEYIVLREEDIFCRLLTREYVRQMVEDMEQGFEDYELFDDDGSEDEGVIKTSKNLIQLDPDTLKH